MTGSALFKRLRPGLDPNGSFWAMLRYPEDWARAEGGGAVWNPAKGGLELAPLARPELAPDWLPLAPVASPNGDLYRSDPERALILRRRACDPDFLPIPGLGGEGPATGQFRAPTGVAVDGAGRVYVADPGNGRVQVIDPEAGAVIATLDAGMELPVHMAVAADGTIYVADAGSGAVFAFSERFQFCAALPLATSDPQSGALWTAPPDAMPLAIAILADGTLALFDPHRPMLWHLTVDGDPLPALGWFEETDLPPGWSPAPRRFVAEADLVLGPIDGGIHDLPWHRVELAAEMPEGTAIEVQTFAANDADADLRAWAPERPLAMPQAVADRPEAPFDRLILSDQALWPLSRLGRMTRAAPVIATLEDGPNAASQMQLPRAAAAQVRQGDRLRLTAPAAGEELAEVAAVGVPLWTVAATGEAADFAAPARVSLIERDGRALPYGPLDLSFLAPVPPALAPSRTNGRPGEMALPETLAGILRAGDVIELGGTGRARVELIEPVDAAVEITLAAPVIGDFALCSVALDRAPGRLTLREALPATGPLPPGARISVIYDDGSEAAEPVWADAESGTLWLAADPPGPSAGVSAAEAWTNAQVPEAQSTDRGRYLWLRLKMISRGLPPPGRIGPALVATASPVVKSLRITAPRYSLLDWLPPVFARREPELEPPGANFLERFLALFEGQFTRAEAAFDSISRLLNPRAADDDWLSFVAAWLEFSFDPSWPVERRRQLVIEGADLQAARGTPAALVRYLEIYTGNAVGITEGFRTRPPEPIQLGSRGALGIAPLGGENLAGDLAHRFSVTVTLPGRADRRTELSAVKKIVNGMKPAHTDYGLLTGGAGVPRIGMGTAVGTIVIPGPGRPKPCTCDPDAEPGDRAQPGALAGGGFRLGGRLGHHGTPAFRPHGGSHVQVA